MPSLPHTIPTDLATLTAIEEAAHDRWNPVWQWLLVGLLFVCFIFNTVKPLLWPDCHVESGFLLHGETDLER
ncbi:hypothetical protein P171DRAFT_490156 [Karstenula rhodostoma CBS 690.94]|uniref:Uncharacterized protein n=1 Tax=Karstenula rhodostoma CBS 690.94 TaxID=1392251 RepID=A0A9P4PAD2_9PLEO|nr:hypothetical protein P171DRAFT_490156 [Karstenula rhodostoma CBS 690.94]